LAIIQNVQKLAGERTNVVIMVTPTDMVGVFLFSAFRFPASTLNVGRGFVHFLCLYTGEVLAGYFDNWLDALV
jgi:hypothetical protein